MNNIKLKSHHHCVFNLKYHLVPVIKYRYKCFTNEILEDLKLICTNICKLWPCNLIEFGGEVGHIHLLIEAHPAMALHRFVNNFKTVTSRLIKKNMSYISKNFIENLLFGQELIAYSAQLVSQSK